MEVPHRRAAERVPTPEPLPGTIGEVSMTVAEIARLGCRIKHEPRLVVGSTWDDVIFQWGKNQLRFHAEIVWSKLLLEGGTKSYESGLRFSDDDKAELAKLQLILETYLDDSLYEVGGVSDDEVEDRAGAPPKPIIPTPFFGDPDASLPGEAYREYRLIGEEWRTQEIDVPLQPRDGFCLPATTPDSDVEGYKISYAAADEATQRMIRASLEMKIK